METYKEKILTVFLNGTWFLDEKQHRTFNRISDDIQYAWDNWDANIIASYYRGVRPQYAPISFIEQWLSNEDFESDGYNVEELKELFKH